MIPAGLAGLPSLRDGRETLGQRRERAQRLPVAYDNAFAAFISDVMDSDKGSSYFGFDFWTTAIWGRDWREVHRFIAKACQFAACDLFPTLNRKAVKRIPTQLALGAFVIPAQKTGGVPHVHGFLRVPALALNLGRGEALIQTRGRTVRVECALAVERFVVHLREFTDEQPSSLHFDHEHP
jgi:hypothetical protein